VEFDEGRMEFDLVHEPIADLDSPPPPIEGVVIESLQDLRVAKLTCILSRSEPRDLVDLLFLERAGYKPERDLALALPMMLVPFSSRELADYRNELRDRFKALAKHPPLA
jgi:hypothetical protein